MISSLFGSRKIFLESLYVARSELDKEVQENFTEAMLNIHNDLPDGLNAFDHSIEKYIDRR